MTKFLSSINFLGRYVTKMVKILNKMDMTMQENKTPRSELFFFKVQDLNMAPALNRHGLAMSPHAPIPRSVL